ncbi:MAG: hypothetical protein WBA45_09700 [Microthrixaceae bacterium]
MITDLDASVVIDDVLIAVDCYSSAWTPAHDRGDHRATRNRSDNLIQKLRDWDDKWRRIAADPPTEIKRRGVRSVVPVVATAGAEWLASDDSDLWITAAIPRICTIAELTQVIDFDFDRLLTFGIEVRLGE